MGANRQHFDQHFAQLDAELLGYLKLLTWRCLTYAPSGVKVAIGDHRGQLFLVDAATGQNEKKTSLSRIGELVDGPAVLQSIAWGPSGAKIAACCNDRLWIVDVGTWHVEQEVAHAHTVISVAWSPSGAKVATGDLGGWLRIVDVATMCVDGSVWHDGHNLRSVAWSPCGAKIATGCEDG